MKKLPFLRSRLGTQTPKLPALAFLLLLSVGALAAWMPPQTRRSLAPKVGAPKAALALNEPQNGKFLPVSSGELDIRGFEPARTVAAPTSTPEPKASLAPKIQAADGACSTVVTNTNNGGAGSLREAINCSNATAGTQTISFNIPGAGVQTIVPVSALPILSDSVTIDGYTQPGSAANSLFEGSNARLRIELNGDFAPASVNGLTLGGGNSNVRGLIINGFDGAGVVLQSANSNGIAGCFIGTNATGTAARGNRDGVLVTSANNIVGGSSLAGITVANRNVISGNTRYGVLISGALATGNSVRGSLIGTNALGTASLGNSSAGVAIIDAQSNTIGLQGPVLRNVISGNGVGALITISGVNPNAAALNKVTGNYIGTDAAGNGDLGNISDGVRIVNASGNSIGDASNGANGRNIISGNGGAGVLLRETAPAIGMSTNSVISNIIGLNAAASARLGNPIGIRVQSPQNFIGNPGSGGSGNFISGNGVGVELSGARAINNRIAVNFIGTGLTGAIGATNLGNTGDGVRISNTSNNEIGVFAENTIAFNGGDGVAVLSGAGNRIERNAIFDNGGLGIDLVAPSDPASGVTPNDDNLPLNTAPLPDTDAGANDLQNFPVLTSATINATGTKVQGTLRSVPTRGFTLLFYASPSADPSGNGEGRQFIGQGQANTDTDGVATINADLTVNAAGQVITATATDAGTNSTSEFSNAVTVTGAALSTVVTNTNDSGAGSLRQAILNGNASPGTQTISFNIPGAGVKTITPTFPGLPPITDPVVINGYSQPGSSVNTRVVGDNAVPLIEISGAATGANTVALDVREGGSGSTIRGLVINGSGVRLLCNSVVVEGCFLGTNAAGTVAVGTADGATSGNINTSLGFASNGGNNRIGGPLPAQRNILAGGLSLFSSLPDIIQGNYIGTDKTGTVALNVGVGIVCASVGGSSTPVGGPIIGGLTSRPGTGAGNLISGNGFGAIRLTASGLFIGPVTVQGNLIGLNANGTTALANSGPAIFIDDANVTGATSSETSSLGPVLIGGTTTGARNVISGNGGDGILSQSNGLVVQGNFIGTDVSGTLDRGNGGSGVSVGGSPSGVFAVNGRSGSATIGGNSAAARNVISGNDNGGIRVGGTSATIQGNFIGTQSNGTSSLPNNGNAISTQTFGSGATTSVQIGGSAEQGNLIAFAASDAIQISNATTGAVRGNTIRDNANRGLVIGGDTTKLRILGNSFFNNGTGAGGNTTLGLAIDLVGFAGSNPNDAGDADIGPNGLQNFPVITSATTTTVSGTLASAPNTTYRVEVFQNDAPDPSGFGEGQQFAFFIEVRTNAQGNANFSSSPTTPLGAGQFITATATRLDSARNPIETSEFSGGVQVSGVTRTATTTTLASSLNPSTFGQNVIFTARVQPANTPAPNGTVTFRDGATTLGTVNLTTNETATFATSSLNVGTHAITATYNGDARYNASTSPVVNQIVSALPALPTLSINDASIGEGNSGSVAARFTVTLSRASALPITVTVASSTGGVRPATVGTDYRALLPRTLTFNPGGPLSQTVNVTVLGDTLDEQNETFLVNLSVPQNATLADSQGVGTILDDDDTPEATFSISDVRINEGNTGTRNATFLVSLARQGVTGTVQVQFATNNNTAVSGQDYNAVSGTLVFAPGESARTVAITVRGDTIREANETFFVNLSNPQNATISDARGVGTINNDDFFADLQITQSVSPSSVGVGGTAIFTLLIRNNGPDTARNAVVVNTLPNGVVLLSSDPAASVSGQLLTFALGTLANGATRTLSIRVRVPNAPGSLTNSATVSGTLPDPVASNNSSTGLAAVVVGARNITNQVQIARGSLIPIGPYTPGLYRAGQRFVQSVTIRNGGTAAISGPFYLVLDNVPNGVTVVNRNGSTVNAAPLGSPFLRLNVGSEGVLSPGESASVRLEFVISQSAAPNFTARVLAGAGTP